MKVEAWRSKERIMEHQDKDFNLLENGLLMTFLSAFHCHFHKASPPSINFPAFFKSIFWGVNSYPSAPFYSTSCAHAHVNLLNHLNHVLGFFHLRLELFTCWKMLHPLRMQHEKSYRFIFYFIFLYFVLRKC